MDDVRVELGFGLVPLINDVQGRRLTDQIKALRKSLAQDLGFVMPSVRILDNVQIAPDAYTIRVREMDAGEGKLKIGALLAMDPSGAGVAIPGEWVKEPAFGLDAVWIDERGTSGDLSEVWVRCECKAERQMIEATKPDMHALGRCDGWEPWLGPRVKEPCDEWNRMLVRTASNAYFPLTMSVISLPDRDEAIAKAVDQVWEHYLQYVEELFSQVGM